LIFVSSSFFLSLSLQALASFTQPRKEKEDVYEEKERE
jgi:hypothetical protein